MSEEEKVISLESDFGKNKFHAQSVCKDWSDRIPECMRLNARELYLEVGIKYPRHFNYSNMFTVVEYNQTNHEFITKADNACEYFYRKSVAVYH